MAAVLHQCHWLNSSQSLYATPYPSYAISIKMATPMGEWLAWKRQTVEWLFSLFLIRQELFKDFLTGQQFWIRLLANVWEVSFSCDKYLREKQFLGVGNEEYSNVLKKGIVHYAMMMVTCLFSNSNSKSMYKCHWFSSVTASLIA